MMCWKKKGRAVLVVALTTLIVVCVGCAGKDTTEQQKPAQAPAEKTFEVETDYCTISYPEKWENKVEIEKEEKDDETCMVSFCAKATEEDAEQKLFDISFGVDQKDAIGVIQTDDGEVFMDMYLYQFENMDALSSKRLDQLMQMQDYSFDILQMLTDQYSFQYVE